MPIRVVNVRTAEPGESERDRLLRELQVANNRIAVLEAERVAVRDALEQYLIHPLFQSESLADAVHEVARILGEGDHADARRVFE
jgi:hypothetical protein